MMITIQRVLHGRCLTLDEVKRLPTLDSGHFDNEILRFEEGLYTTDQAISYAATRVLLSRMTVADGAPYNNQVTVETLGPKGWTTVREYQAK